MIQGIRSFFRDSKAVSALEYAILVGVIVVAAVVAMNQFTTDMKTSIDKVGTNIKATAKDAGKAN